MLYIFVLPYFCASARLTFYRTYKDELKVYLLMDAYLGGELYHLLKAGPLPEDNAKFCSASVLEALDYLHIRAIAYRDMKPENLMIDHTLVFMNNLDRDSKVLNIICVCKQCFL